MALAASVPTHLHTSLLQALKAPTLPVYRSLLLSLASTPSLPHAVVYDIYERAVRDFPTDFGLWYEYLKLRSGHVMGKSKRDWVEGRPRKRFRTEEEEESVGVVAYLEKTEGRYFKGATQDDDEEEEEEEDELELEEAEMDFAEGPWEGGKDPVKGWREWRELVGCFERALAYLPKMPRIWLMLFTVFLHQKCPASLQHTHARRTFDRALRSLPTSLHTRIWRPYLRWSTRRGGLTAQRVWKRALTIYPSLEPLYIKLLLSPLNPAPQPLVALKSGLRLAILAQKGKYKDTRGRSTYQLVEDWMEGVEEWGEQVGVEDEEIGEGEGEGGGEGMEVAEDGDTLPPYADPSNPDKIPVRQVVLKHGVKPFPDQAGPLFASLALYYIKRSSIDAAQRTFEEGLQKVLTVRDFTKVFDAYVAFLEMLVSSLVEAEEEDGEDGGEETDGRMREFEELMDRRPFLVNEVLLRRNRDDVQEWEKRVVLYGEDDAMVAKTYTEALSTIDPRKATAGLHRLYINFAKFYETGGSSSKGDVSSARQVFEKATTVQFRKVDELAEVWIERAEMELRLGNFEEARKVMERATAVPKSAKGVGYFNENLPVQQRLFKSLKLWSFYVDLEESIGTVESTKRVYDLMFQLKIANPQTVVNYANFLEENEYFEESFKVYERGVESFTFPVVFEIWNIYLSKFVKRYGGDKLERTRDLFEQALEKCPPKFCKPIFLMYGKLEEEHGLAKRAMRIYERATEMVESEDKFEMYTFYVAKATANFGLPAARKIYEKAIESLPDRETAEMCLRFSAMEKKLGEIDRARRIFGYGAQFCDPRTMAKYWKEWNDFEVDHGSEDTFREMLRIKRSVQASFNTESSYIAARVENARAGKAPPPSVSEARDPMASLETGRKGAFVPASTNKAREDGPENAAVLKNKDEIEIDDAEEF
ncbi:TPR-like protein [Atractiella rhizophila]|nr:TPR-like protein [Atractiella rhizophila]